jgi:hypothetical protein
MKKGLLITLGVVAFILGALLLIPILFKDQIQEKIDQEISNTINAQVVLDPQKISLSVFRNFPNITISVDGFAGDTLFAAKTTRLVADIMSVISGDKIKIKAFLLDQPLILTKFTKDGKMSWDIAIPSDEATEEPESDEPSEFNVGIEEWEIRNGRIVYIDESMPMFMEILDFNHKGSGDLNQEAFVMDTWTKASGTFVQYEGVKYLNNAVLEATAKMDINYDKMVFKFLDNEFKVNDFALGMDGEFAMPGDDMVFDITYKAKETSFKTLLSLVPAIYAKDFETIKTDGSLAFDGWVKGIMNDSLMPGYALNLVVNNAMFQYPDLPTAVKNIAIDLHVENKDGKTENMFINLKNLHLEMGNNPVDAKIVVEGLEPSKIDANIQATLNLEDITKFYPLDSMTLKGLFSIDVQANGIYSETSMPKVNAAMSMKNGYVKTADVPEPIEDISFKTYVKNTDGSLAATIINLENFQMKFQNEPFYIKAFVENLDNPKYDVTLKGILDLGKLTKIFPLDDMTLDGRIAADVATKGVMSDIDAGNYLNTSTSGSMDVTNLVYEAKDFPQGIKLSTAKFAFSPQKATINTMKGSVGKSDIDVDGYVTNYMGYMFGAADSTIRGKMNFRSNSFDVNEWMTEDETTEASTAAEADTGLVLIPKNIDFVLTSSLKKVLYTNMVMEDMTGDIIIKDGIARMHQLAFNTLGGSIMTNGSYNTQDEKNPKFDMDLDIKELGIKDAYSTFNTVKSFAPVAQNIDGNFSTKVKMAGNLDNAMSPIMSTLYGAGSLNVASATLKNGKVLESISGITKMANILPLQLKDVLVQFEIIDGKVFVKPFDVNAGQTKMNIQGNQSIEGALDYLINMDVPAGAVGTQINSAINSITGNSASPSDRIKLNLKVLGTYDSPKVTLASSSNSSDTKGAVKDAVKAKVVDEIKNNEQINKAKEELEARRKAEEEKLRAEQERIKKETEARIQAEKEKAKKELEDKAKDALKKNIPKF